MTGDDKDLSQSIDDFFDIRSLSAVLLGFTLLEWIKTLITLTIGTNSATLAIVWPILFVIFAVIMANAGKKTNHDLKREEFKEKIEQMFDESEEQDDD